MIGNDREGFERRTRQRLGLVLLPAQEESQVLGGAERPFVAAPDEVDAARRIARLEGQQQSAYVGAFAHIG
ncbi:hypothetical protein D9M68_966300 [compost metagenome]